MMRRLLDALRGDARKRFKSALETEALRHTRSLMRGFPEPQLELEVWGHDRANAYMAVGWHPVSQGWADKIPVYHLKIEHWDES